MTITPTLQRYLSSKNIEYDVIAHQPINSSMRTAKACRIPADRLAKAAVLRKERAFALAVLPASHHINLSDLEAQLGFDVDLATEDEIEQLFGDCAQGAVPPIGEGYGLDVIVDDSIEAQSEVYLEGGNHVTLVHMSRAQFARFTGENVWRGHFGF